ncbi:MAG: hypothetical protein K1X57_03555 [Gemmataceae bacterium]|nr:hypothetical protein [Gemmataceae bacterium]
MAEVWLEANCPNCRVRLRFRQSQLQETLRCSECQCCVRPQIRERPAMPGAFTPPMDPALGTLPEPASIRAGRYQPQQRKTGRIAIGVAATLGIIALGVAFANREALSGKPTTKPAVAQKPASQPATAPNEKEKAGIAASYPRRILAISIHQYFFLNPTLFGSPKRSTGAWVERVSEKWNIPRDQIFLLTDAANNRGSIPPIKPIIEATIESYLASSRPQDRIVLLWCGHATALDGKAYLVPIDGELTNKDSLIGLDWLYDRMAKCSARQKLLIFDAARRDPGRGQERPGPGPLDPVVGKALAAPPAGVQVWSSCSNTEQSLEFKYAIHENADFEGSVFLNSFFHAFLSGAASDSKPDDAIPIDGLVDRVNKLTRSAVLGLEKQSQTPFLAGTPSNEGAAHDPAEPSPTRVVIPKPSSLARGGLADPSVVKAIFDEVRCPPIRATSADKALTTDDLEGVFPFSAETLARYAADYKNLQEVTENPQKYPLRVAVLKAVEVLDRHSRGDVLVGASRKQVGLLREEFTGPSSDNIKKTIAREQQEGPAAMYLELEDLVKSLEKVGRSKSEEKSQRWLAHFDYVLAMTKSRFAYINEYNFLLGKIRKDELPPIDSKLHKGWRLASVEKMSSPRDIKDQAEDARKLFAKIIREHPGTPWEVLAKRDRMTAIGLSWQPAAVKE